MSDLRFCLTIKSRDHVARKIAVSDIGLS